MAASSAPSRQLPSHFIPGDAPYTSDETWADEVRRHSGCNCSIGHDLLTL